MKKIILIIAIVILFSGCGKETVLNCTKQENGYTNNIKLTFKKDSIKSYTFDSIYEDDNDYKSECEYVKQYLENSEMKVKCNNKTLSYSSDLSTFLIGYFGVKEELVTYEYAQNEMIKDGYTCK